MSSLTDPGGVHRLRIETQQADDSAFVVIRGEADLATLRDLDLALDDLELDGARSVHLHLDELEFADVATIRLLTDFARQAAQDGRAVKTCGAGPLLRRVAQLLQVHHDLGLT